MLIWKKFIFLMKYFDFSVHQVLALSRELAVLRKQKLSQWAHFTITRFSMEPAALLSVETVLWKNTSLGKLRSKSWFSLGHQNGREKILWIWTFHCGLFNDKTVIVYHSQFDNNGVQSKKRFKGSKRKISIIEKTEEKNFSVEKYGSEFSSVGDLTK